MQKIFKLVLILGIMGTGIGCATSKVIEKGSVNPALIGITSTTAAGLTATAITSVSSDSCTTTSENNGDIIHIMDHSKSPLTGETVTSDIDIPTVMNEKVKYFINYFSNVQHDVFVKWLERSERYIPEMKEILKEHGLPEDLVYMALIESGFNTKAVSSKRACGQWQFIRSTARLYGLKVNWWIDERRNPEKATLAAALYLKNLYDTFGSWYLAEAAYNAGPIKIMHAIQLKKTDNFWKLSEYRYLRKETRDYVPKLIAAAMIAKNPVMFGFTELTYEKPIIDDKVVLDHQIDLHVAARLADVSYKVIKELNPELLRWATPPVKSYTLNLPDGTKTQFLKGLKKIPQRDWFTYKRYVIRQGDTLYAISRLYGVPIARLREMNRIRFVRYLRPGHAIIIPVSPYEHRRPIEYTEIRHARYVTMHSASTNYIYYRVRNGDTLWDISRKFDVSIHRIKYINHIYRTSFIKPNMVLRIPRVFASEG
ncbi:MAG: LysM peptidoglycan-binding domain-containing protein [Deltaproteobacteria bacterium]|nr:LysM peptidoglycan-binding domain-containing protein [Deltaproteobacteria bacterium]